MIDDNRSFSRWFVILAILSALAFGALSFLRVGGVPEIKIEPALPAIGRRTPIRIDVSEPKRGLTRVIVQLAYGDKVETLAEKSYASRSAYTLWGPRTERDAITVAVGTETTPGLKGENAAVRVVAERAGTWLRRPDPVTVALILPVRLTPPTLQVLSSRTYVAQGGSEVVVYRAGESSRRDGVQSGSLWFPGFPLPGGGKQDRFALFAVPFDLPRPDVHLVAEDDAGNGAELSFVDEFFPKPFRSDTVVLSDSFMRKVVPEILAQSPEIRDMGDLLKNYLMINGDLRRRQNEKLMEIAHQSRSEFLWRRPFLMMHNSKVMAAFADRRAYEYNGRIVDHQDHLGYDLAVTQQAPIPAANDGVVVLARFFGIYGNAVIIDHGFGLMSLYGHLSSLSVKEGQKVVRGEVIGRTGMTGLAAGDHLHFSMMLQGTPVNPLEWWDERWIQNRIRSKLAIPD